jgi:hypothetical protein
MHKEFCWENVLQNGHMKERKYGMIKLRWILRKTWHDKARMDLKEKGYEDESDSRSHSEVDFGVSGVETSSATTKQ